VNFTGATRKQFDKPNNDDAFAVFGGDIAVLCDGAGNARSAAHKALASLQPPFANLGQIVNRLNTVMLGLGSESTLVAIQVTGDLLLEVSAGDSILMVYRDGTLHRLNHNTRRRLGSGAPELCESRFSLNRYDVILLASDGLTLDKYRLTETVKRYMLQPSDLPEAILSAQRDASDDVTVVCGVNV